MRQRARSLTPSLEWNCQTASDILRDVRDSIEIARMKGKCSYCVLSVSVVRYCVLSVSVVHQCVLSVSIVCYFPDSSCSVEVALMTMTTATFCCSSSVTSQFSALPCPAAQYV